jgi:hypothetical protein
MGLERASGTFSQSAAGDRVISGLSFQPKLIYLIGCDDAPLDSISGDETRLVIGVGSGVAAGAQGCVAVINEDGATTSNMRQCIFDDRIYVDPRLANGALDGSATLSAISSDGFTINFTGGYATAKNFAWVAIGGDGVSAEVKRFSLANAGATQDFTGFGFEPSAMQFLSIGNSTINPAAAGAFGAGVSFGVIDGAGNEWVTCFRSENAQGTADTGSFFNSSACLAAFPVTDANSLDFVADFNSWLATGVRLNVPNLPASSTTPFLAIALDGVASKAGIGTRPTSATTDVETGAGLTPEIGFFSSNAAQVSGSARAGVRWFFGIDLGGTEEYALAYGDEDGVGTISNSSYFSTASSFQEFHSNVSGFTAVAQVQSFDTDGFTLSFSSADASAVDYGYFLLGDPGVSLSPTAIATAEALGTPLAHATTAPPSSIASGEAVGPVAVNQTLYVTSIASGEAVGTPTLTWQQFLSPTSIGSSEAFGTPTITTAFVRYPVSIETAEALGTPSLQLGAITRSILAITSGEVVGIPPPPNRTMYPTTITSAEALGTPTVQPGAISRTIIGIPTEEAVSNISAIGYARVEPVGIPSQEAFGTPTTLNPATFAIPAATAYADAPVPAMPGVYEVGGLAHFFIEPGGDLAGARQLPDLSGGRKRFVASYRDLLTTSGGFMSATAQVPQAELTEYPDHFRAGATWLVKDLALNKFIFGGVLNRPEKNAGVGTLSADGWGLDADHDVLRWRWQARPGEWIDATSFPFKYRKGDVYDQTRILVGMIAARHSKLDEEAQLEFWIPEGTVFKHENGAFEWHGTLVQWTPGNNHKRISFEIHKNKDDAKYTLELVGATSYDLSNEATAFTVIDSWTMGSATGTGNTLDDEVGFQVDVNIPGSYELIGLRMKRSDKTDKTAAGRKFRLRNCKVWGQRGTQQNTLHIDDAFGDIFTRLGAVETLIDVSTFDILPYDAERATIAQIADELALYAGKWFWRMSATTAGEKKGEAARYGTPLGNNPGEWEVVHVQQPVQFLPEQQYNRIAFDYKLGSETQLKKLDATINPYPDDYIKEYRLEIEEPPREAIATAFAQNIIDYLSEERATGNATLAYVRNPVTGAIKRAHIVEPGDRLYFVAQDRRVFVSEIAHADSLVEVTFASGNPLLDKWLARRKRKLSLGFSNAQATLGPLGLDKPEKPLDFNLAFEDVTRKAGSKSFDAILDWDPVTLDINGKATAIREYVIQGRPLHLVGGNWVPVEDKKQWIKERVKDTPADADDDIPTRLRIRDIDNPGKWRWQFRIMAIDVLDKESGFTDWTPNTSAAKPTNFGPRDVTQVIADLDQHNMKVRFIATESGGNDADGNPSLDRTVHHFKYQIQKNTGTPGAPVWTTQSFDGKDTFFTRSDHFKIGLKKPGRTTEWRVRAKAVDNWGNVSDNWTNSSATTRAIPPTPAGPVAGDITFEDGGKEGFTARFAFNYTGSYTDDDIVRVHTKWIRDVASIPDANADNEEVRHRDHISFDADDAITGRSSWRGLRKNRYIRVAYCVEDAKGHRSAWSPWSPNKQVGRSRKPNKVTNRRADPAAQAVRTSFDWPTAWDNGDPFDSSDVDTVTVTLKRSPTGNTGTFVDVDTIESKSRKNTFHLTKSQFDSWKTHKFKIAVDINPVDGDPVVDLQADFESGVQASPEAAGVSDFSELTGSVDYTDLGSTLGISRMGTTTQMNAASAKDGDIWINTSFSPTRVYRRVSGAWVYQLHGDVLQVGTVVADGIVAGAIDGEVITGATVQTAAAGSRVVLDGAGAQDSVQFFSGATLKGSIKWNGFSILISNFDAAGSLHLSSSGDIVLNASGGNVNIGGDTQTDGLLIGTTTGDPPTGYVRLYKNANEVWAKAPGRAAVLAFAV